MIYHLFSRNIVACAVKNGIISEKYSDVYAYGLETVISTLANIALVTVAGSILGIGTEVVVYMLFYSLIRMTTGGAHADSHIKCIAIYLLIALPLIKAEQLPLIQDTAAYWTLILVSAGNILVLSLGPVDHPNNRMEDETKRKLKKKAGLVLILEDMAILAAVCFFGKEAGNYALAASTAVFIQGMLLLPVFNRAKEMPGRTEAVNE